jgi:uncharacterized protein YxjI
MATEIFNKDYYLIRRKVLKLIGASFHIYDNKQNLLFYVEQKGFKLKEDIRVFTSEDMMEEVLLIQARNAIDFSGTYDVFESNTNKKIGALRRKGLKSMFKDEWLILDSADNELGNIKEDHMGLAIIRRFIISIIPQNFIGTLNNHPVFTFKQKFNPIVSKTELDFSVDKNNLLDRRLGIAAGILLCTIEGRQG